MEVPRGYDEERSSQNKTIVLDFSTMKAFLSEVTSQLQGRITLDTIRPINMLMGISGGHSLCFSPEAFAPPVRKLDKSTPEKFKSRIKLNLSFFLSNYALVTAMVAVVVALMYPGMIAWLLVLWGLWGFHTFLISNEVLLFGRNIGTLVSITHRSNGLSLISCVVIIYKCLWPAITVVTLSSLLICSHAVMRDPKHIETSKNNNNTFGHGHHRNDSDNESGGSGSNESEVLVDRPIV